MWDYIEADRESKINQACQSWWDWLKIRVHRVLLRSCTFGVVRGKKLRSLCGWCICDYRNKQRPDKQYLGDSNYVWAVWGKREQKLRAWAIASRFYLWERKREGRRKEKEVQSWGDGRRVFSLDNSTLAQLVIGSAFWNEVDVILYKNAVSLVFITK